MLSGLGLSPMVWTEDATLVVILLVLIVVPRALQRYRLPAPVTSLLFGFAAHQLGLVTSSPAIGLLSTLGIVALFLFAGLEIQGAELRRDARVLLQYGAIWGVVVSLTAWAGFRILALPIRPATLVALALLTPSTGFILSSLSSFGYSASEQFAIKTKAIAAELFALAILFVTMQSASGRQLGLAVLALAAIVVVIPLAFRFFAAVVSPYAPRSEFAFLLGVAVVTAIVTHALGVYYLLGAFLVGVAAQRFRARLPALSSEQIVNALEAFGSVFIPFYFFAAGLRIDAGQAGWLALAFGAALLAVFVPVRIAIIALHRKWFLRETQAESRRVAVALVPTLVFTLVLAQLLRDVFAVPGYITGALTIYTVLNTTLPGFVSGGRVAPIEPYEAPIVSALPAPVTHEQ